MSAAPAQTLRLRGLILSVILAAVGYLGFSIWGGWHEVIGAISRVSWLALLGLLALSLVNYGLRYLRWHHYLVLLQHRLPWTTTLTIYLSGFALTTTPGKAGEVLRSFLLKPLGVPYAPSIATLLAERLGDLLAILVLASVGLFAYQDARPVVLVLAVGLIFGLWLLQRRRWLQWLDGYLRQRFHGRLADLLAGLIETMLHSGSLFTLPLLSYSLVLGVVAWGAEGVAFYWLVQILGLDIGLDVAMFIYAFAMLVGAVSFLPGGLGGTEVTMTALLVVNGMSEGEAVAATVLIRLTTLWFAVALGLLALLFRGRNSV